MRTLTLYSTSACHLCELAMEIISPALKTHQLALKVIDISESDELMDRYGVRIPVLRFDDSELDWPFDKKEFLAFVG